MGSRPFTAFLALATCTLLHAGPAVAQNSALQKRLAGIRSLDCSFAVVATANWKDGVPIATVAPAKITVKFANVNVDEGTADAVGTFGGSLVVVRHTNDYLHLMHMHRSGPLHTTTVLARETKGGRLLAVHTRHEYTDVQLPGFTSRPEMYVGECAVES